MTRDEAIAKIRKLLQTNGRTHSEANTAEMLAAALASKHGIDIAELDRIEEAKRVEITHRELGEWSRMPVEATYASIICKNFFEVSAFTRTGWTDRMCFVGTAWHLDIAEYVFHFLVKEFRWQWNHKRGRCRNRSGFIFGAFVALTAKLNERFERKEPSNALEVSWAAKREQYIAENFGKMETSSCRPKKTGAALQHGYRAGRNIEIRPGVAGNDATPAQQIGFESRLLQAPNQ